MNAGRGERAEQHTIVPRVLGQAQETTTDKSRPR